MSHKRRKKNLLLYIVPAIVLLSCQKKEEQAATPTKATIIINSPATGQVISKGDSVAISADISYVSLMHGYITEIRNLKTGNLVYTNEDHTHGDKLKVAEKWMDTLNEQTDLLLRVIAVIDHNNTQAVDSIIFKSQP